MDFMAKVKEHFPEATPEEIQGFLAEIQAIYPTATEEVLLQVMDKALTSEMSPEDKIHKLFEIAHKAADKKKELQMNALKGKIK